MDAKEILFRKFAIVYLFICCGFIASAQNTKSEMRDAAFSIYNTKDSVRIKKFNIGLIGGADTLHGIQANALISFARKEMWGLQVAGLSNFADNLQGMQVSAFSNISSSPFRGVQLSGIANISMGVKKGMQISSLVNVSSEYMQGLQVGTYNYADTLNGSQVGLINVAVNHPKGIQIGLINYTRDTIANKIGLVNINPKTKIDMMFFGGTSSKLNLALRFRNHSTYSMIGFGTHYMGFDEQFSGALFYRLGQYFHINERLSLSGDLGFFHIETFKKHSAEGPERLYSLQARVNADYKINDRIAVFASVGYGDTRYYEHSRRYRHRPILEAGLSMRYKQKKSYGREVPNSIENIPDTASIFAFDNPENMHKNPWIAGIEVFGINAFVNGFDRYALNEDYAKISARSVRNNIEKGFVWDNDQFSTNLFSHPYHGGLYFNSARSNGMTFWESAPYALGGSLMWEIACETEPPAINDLIATTAGGICIGEITHRISNLVYDDSKRGFNRFLREFAGTVICPMKGLNRIIKGEAWRVRKEYYKYHDYNRIPVDFSFSVGDRYLADEGALFRGEHNPYIDLKLVYGDAFDEDCSKPYEYFSANMTVGLGSSQPLITGIHLLGRLWSANVYENNGIDIDFGLFQHFNYYDSEAVKEGSSRVPYRISEAASFGPGLIYRFPKVGNIGVLEQRLFFDAILLGGSLSDYYNVAERDYNMGSGYSTKVQTLMEFPRFGRFSLNADFYRIYTWKGYDEKDLASTSPLYLNAQGDKGSAELFVVSPQFDIYLKGGWSLNFFGSYYSRKTRYKHYDNVESSTFEVRLGLTHSF